VPVHIGWRVKQTGVRLIAFRHRMHAASPLLLNQIVALQCLVAALLTAWAQLTLHLQLEELIKMNARSNIILGPMAPLVPVLLSVAVVHLIRRSVGLGL
jgi:hypothetical protein